MILAALVALLPLTAPASTPVAYGSINAAAVAAETVAMSLSADGNEWGGVVYSVGDEYFFTVAVTLRDPVSVSYRVALPHGGKLEGLYHTHPDATSALYSLEDVSTARRLGLPSFIGLVRMKETVRFDPSGTARYRTVYGVRVS